MGFGQNFIKDLKQELRSIEPVNLADVFSRAWKLFIENFILFISIWSLPFFPKIIRIILGFPINSPRGLFLESWALIGIFSGAATITAVSYRYKNESINLIQAFKNTQGKYLAYFGARIAYGLQFVLGLIFLLFPGLYILAMNSCAPTIAVLEPRMDFFETSRTLVRGSFARVLIFVLLGWTVHVVVRYFVKLNLIERDNLGMIVFSLLWTSFWTVSNVVLYLKLKERKDLQVKRGSAKLKFYGFFNNEKGEKVSWSFEAPSEGELLIHLKKIRWQILEIKKVCYEDSELSLK